MSKKTIVNLGLDEDTIRTFQKAGLDPQKEMDEVFKDSDFKVKVTKKRKS